MNHQSIREECLQANLDLVARNLVDMTFGNVSVYDPQLKVFAIKPSGVDYDKLVPSDMPVVDLDGTVVDGDLSPSSDMPTHRCLYLAFAGKGVRAVVHTHSRCAVSFAQAGKPIPCFGTTHADFFDGNVPVTRLMTENEINGAYERETGQVIVEAFEGRDPTRTPAVLVQCHGPFTWGSSGAEAVQNALALEIVADMAAKTLLLNPTQAEIPSVLHQKHFNRKHGPGAYYGQKKK